MDDDLFDDGPVVQQEQDNDSIFDENEETREEPAVFEPSPVEDFSNKMSAFDQAVARLKQNSKKKQVEITPEEANDYCRHMMSFLNNAHLADEQSIAKGEPATAKLQLIHVFVNEMAKKKMTDALLENGLGRLLQLWLLPDESRSLPSLTIRSKLVEALEGMDLDYDGLVTSGIAKTILMLWKIETDINVRQRCANLCMKWLNSALAQGQTSLPGKNANAAAISEKMRREAEKNSVSRLYATAPARSYLQAPKAEYKGDSLNLNITINRRNRELRNKK